MKLTQERLKELVHYDPETGIFTRKVKLNNSTPLGEITNNLFKGYLRFRVCGEYYLAHRLAWLYMTGDWPKEYIDHINCVRDDNRWENLREANRSQNNSNVKPRKNSLSKYKGVSWHKKNASWRARISVNNNSIALGYFSSELEAAKAYNEAAKKYHGEYAYLNSL